jgi:two-component system, cell cycle sensor histidine kinase and response regulator CckA
VPATDTSIGVSRFSQAILDSFAVNIAVLNKDGVITAVNKGWTLFAAENAGPRVLSTEVGVNYLDVIAEKWGPYDGSEKAAANGILKVVRGTLPEFSLEYETQAVDGHRWFLLHIIALLEDSTEAALVSHYDITARKLAEIKKEDNAEQFQELANHLHQVFWIKDAVDTRTLYVSPAFEQIWGRTCQSIYDNPASFRESIHPEDREIMSGSLADKDQTGGFDGEYRILRPDGTIRWIWARDYPVRDENGNLKRLVGIAEDITDRKQLEAQFIEAQKMEVVGQLAAGVAHDFNNVLGVIMGYGELLAQELAPDNPLQKYAEEIRHAGERAAGLTKQLLIFSRKQTVEAVILNLNQSVESMEKMLRRLVDENVEMRIVYDKEGGCIKADSGYIWQVLMNLVVNARDAMPAGGKLTIVTSCETLDDQYAESRTGVIAGDYMTLTVSDTGMGMTPEVKARLFEAFFTTKPLGKGTGLGLVTCQTIIRQAGGHIEVVSVPDIGTTFKIYFPKVSPLPKDETPLMSKTGPLPKSTETLLLVEDEPSLRRLAQGVLQGLGYTVLAAPNGQDALRIAQEHRGAPISLVVTDVIMPRMGGKVMAESLKASYPDIKILFTSGYTDDALTSHGVFDPGVAFLPKPYNPAALARKVRQMLNT